jgi:uridine nucleosidase
MIPLNVTHKAIVTDSLHDQVINWNPLEAHSRIASSRLRHTLSTLISFFKDAYKSTFAFMDGPPLHDALTIAYVSQPELFTTRRYRVDVELSGIHTAGQTVADVREYLKVDDTWGRTGKNCEVAMDLDVCIIPCIFIDWIWILTGPLLRSRGFSGCSLIALQNAMGYHR